MTARLRRKPVSCREGMTRSKGLAPDGQTISERVCCGCLRITDPGPRCAQVTNTAARNRNLTRTVLYSAAHPAAFAAAHRYSLWFPPARSALHCPFDRLDSRPTRSSAMVLISAHHSLAHLLTSTSMAITPPGKSSARSFIIHPHARRSARTRIGL